MSIAKVHIQSSTPFVGSFVRRPSNPSRHLSSSISSHNDVVTVKITNGPRNSRFVLGSLLVHAPIEALWTSLTDYDNLADFIPSLAVNECLERKPNGAILKQVGQQNLALGMKFCATAVLEIGEYMNGICQEVCWYANQQNRVWDEEQCFPTPDPQSRFSLPRDITFDQIRGDFQAFKGLWRMQDVEQDPSITHLSYSLFIRPQLWLPVSLIQGRISSETKNNLLAVKKHAEKLSLIF